MKPDPEIYSTNDLASLKREALVAGDIETLKTVKMYDTHRASRQFFYARENETIVRDRLGSEILISSLPFDQDEISLHLIDINMGKALPHMADKPGDLSRDISLFTQTRCNAAVIILEVPGETDFPLPDSFNWLEMCKGQQIRKYSTRHRTRMNGFTW